MTAKTKQKIERAFLKLLNERPLNQITVIDIAKECKINRNTFYYHFRDIPTLVDYIITKYIGEIIAKHPSPDSFGECLLAISDFVTKNRVIFEHIYRFLPRITFEKYIWKLCQHFVDSYWQGAGGLTAPQDALLVKRFFVCALFGVAVDGIYNRSSDFNEFIVSRAEAERLGVRQDGSALSSVDALFNELRSRFV